MDLKVLLNDAPKVLHRSSISSHRSSSISHSATEPSPSTSAAKLPTPPHSTPIRPRKARGKNDPKPIWAILENEALPAGYVQAAPPAPVVHVQPPQPATVCTAYENDSQPPTKRRRVAAPGVLSAFEKPVTDDATVYDDVTCNLRDFIWENVAESQLVRDAVAEGKQTGTAEIEIEARFGQILDPNGLRLTGIHQTECLVRQDLAAGYRFESTMSLDQHEKMNKLLNLQVQKSKDPKFMRTDIDYKHTKEIDTLYELDRDGLNLLPPFARQLIAQSKSRQKVRVTRDMKDGSVVRKLIKCRIGNIEISSPLTEWDYRVGINLEVVYPGPIENLRPIMENARPGIERKKDRISYSWLSAYQTDLTQVVQGQDRKHELEIELNGPMVVDAMEAAKKGLPNSFEPMVAGLMNNLRVLSRIITPPKI